MAPVALSDAVEYALALLAYCFGLVLFVAVPAGLAVLVGAGGAVTVGGPLAAASLWLATVTVLLAGLGGLLFKIVADGVAVGTGAADDPSASRPADERRD